MTEKRDMQRAFTGMDPRNGPKGPTKEAAKKRWFGYYFKNSQIPLAFLPGEASPIKDW